ncbi:MAG: bifunctional methylenetetrahydrofolate dehydrogenase/methenyltetrahydrofolate cyclohydrolase FolD [Sedimentisphaerales bacterium]|nr:bifunctional methylenetetrahydrofolate dehydrogenase/methenyltetrahydrofolate cyclohydrolase FolD [Sedimentisphaerales bacterium]
MTAKIIDGKQIAEEMKAEFREQVAKLKKKGVTPGLAVILVGDDPASQSYVTSKERDCEEVGIYSDDNRLPAETTQKELIALIEEKNKDPKIHGILVQLPLPKHLNESEVLLAINPDKDVDGFHPINTGKMVSGEKAFLPCTPHGIVQLLIRNKVTIEGADVVIVGRSNLVGKPLANMLIQKKPNANATVTVCHTHTKNLAAHTKRADILVAAVGRVNTITADMVKDGVVVIDVGVNRIDDSSKKSGYRLVGDVDFDAVKEKASLITPVPGGVGPMTRTMLLYNTIEAAKAFVGR